MKILNIIIAFIIFFSASSIVSAQERRNSFIGISGGVSIPVGDFSKTDLGDFGNWNNKTGFAKTGLNLGVEGAYYFLSRLGIGGVINYSDHGGLTQSDAQKLGDSYTDAFAVDYSTVTTDKRYQTLNLLVGPYFSLPCHKFTLEFRLLGGITKSLSTPEIKVQLEDNENSYFTQKSASSAAFGWQAGIGLRYSLAERIGLSIKGDYFSSNGINITNDNRKNDAGRLVTKQQMSWVNVSLGVSYFFGK